MFPCLTDDVGVSLRACSQRAAVGDLYAGAMGRPQRQLPAELAGEPWPDVPASDPLAEVARQFVLNVRAAMEGRSIRAVANEVGIGNVTLLTILAGKAWPDLATIAKLEFGLDAELWPRATGR